MFSYSREKLMDTWDGSHLDHTPFSKYFRVKWDDIHSRPDVLRYKLGNLRGKFLDRKYLLMSNPDRGAKRRLPEQMDNIQQPFDANKFNFTIVNTEEIMFKLIVDDNETDVHNIVVNVSPISKYHSLLCPSVNKCLPQVLTMESIQLALEVMFLSQDRDLRIAFNSLCALASVNHLHYHLFVVPFDLPIENIKCHQLKGPLYCFTDYPVPAFCFGFRNKDSLRRLSEDIYKLIDFLLKRNIAHNMFITRGQSLENDSHEDYIRVIVWPRKNNYNVKQFSAFNTAVCELSGWITVYNDFDYDLLRTDDIEHELKKWMVDDFEGLCNQIKMYFVTK